VAAFIVLFTGMFGLLGWGVMSLIVNLSDFPETDYKWGDPPVVVGLVIAGAVVLGGLWWAWRESTGHWGLRRKPELDSPAGPPGPGPGA
jgi:hypothetical protein